MPRHHSQGYFGIRVHRNTICIHSCPTTGVRIQSYYVAMSAMYSVLSWNKKLQRKRNKWRYECNYEPSVQQYHI